MMITPRKNDKRDLLLMDVMSDEMADESGLFGWFSQN
jgi:hypothetical protein